MDRELPQNIQTRNRLKPIKTIGLIVVLLIAAFFLLRFTLRTTLSSEELLFAPAESGLLEATISGSGEVLPEIEEVMVSPLPGKLTSVLLLPGSTISPGDSILKLNQASSLLELEKLEDQLALKQNEINRLKIERNQTYTDLLTDIRIKELNIKSLEVDLDDKKLLESIGGGTRKEVEKTQLELDIANLELDKLQKNLQVWDAKMKADLNKLAIEAGISSRNISELETKLQQASGVAQREGVITWVNNNLGANLETGAELARIADLSSFKVNGRVSDNYADRLKPGMDVKIRLNRKTELRGKIARINPNVENGILSFEVSLAEKSHVVLRPNLRVDVEVVTATLEDVIRVKNGPAFTGAGPQIIFVRKADKLVRRQGQLGWSSIDHVHIESGVKPGEQVVISDMRKYEHLQEIELND